MSHLFTGNTNVATPVQIKLQHELTSKCDRFLMTHQDMVVAVYVNFIQIFCCAAQNNIIALLYQNATSLVQIFLSH